MKNLDGVNLLEALCLAGVLGSANCTLFDSEVRARSMLLWLRIVRLSELSVFMLDSEGVSERRVGLKRTGVGLR